MGHTVLCSGAQVIGLAMTAAKSGERERPAGGEVGCAKRQARVSNEVSEPCQPVARVDVGLTGLVCVVYTVYRVYNVGVRSRECVQGCDGM